jgi:hypothetical protein
MKFEFRPDPKNIILTPVLSPARGVLGPTASPTSTVQSSIDHCIRFCKRGSVKTSHMLNLDIVLHTPLKQGTVSVL